MKLPALRTRSGFHRVIGEGRGIRSNGIVLHWIENGLTSNRYGIAAKTTVGNAVTRNRVRRWSKELLRELDAEIREGFDLVLLARSPLAAESFTGFKWHLDEVLKKSGLLKDVHELSDNG